MKKPVGEQDGGDESPEPELQQQLNPKFSQPAANMAAGKVSRRAIITKNTKDTSKVEFTSEDQWFSKEKLYKVRKMT